MIEKEGKARREGYVLELVVKQRLRCCISVEVRLP